MKNSRSSLDIKALEDYSQKNARNASRSNSPVFHLQDLSQTEQSKARQESPADKRFTLRNNSNNYYNELSAASNNIYNSGTKTKKVGNNIENIPPQSNYAQMLNNSHNNMSPLQVNIAEQSMVSLRGGNGSSIIDKDATQSKAYISAMKALQEKVKQLEKKCQENQSLHTSQLESLRQEKMQVLSQSSSKAIELEERIRQLDQQMNQIKEDSDKQLRVFKQLESNLKEKLKETERENKEIKEKEDIFHKEIKQRDHEIEELKSQLQMQGESKLFERQQLKQKINELTSMVKDLETEKEGFKKKIDFLEKQFVQYEKELVLARNDSTKDQYIKQLQDQLFQQADFHERERIELQVQHKNMIEQLEKDLIYNQDRISVLIKDNDRLYFDLKLCQDQLEVLTLEKNEQIVEIQKLLSEIHSYQEKGRQQENEQKALQDLADQSRKFNQQLLQSLQNSSQYQPQLRLSDLQSSQVNPTRQNKIPPTFEDQTPEEYWKNSSSNTPLKSSIIYKNLSQQDNYYNNNNIQTNNQQTLQQDQLFSQSLSANRFQNSQRALSRSASHRRQPNISSTENINKIQILEEEDSYSTNFVNNTAGKYQRPEKSPLRNQTIRFKEQEFQQQKDNIAYDGFQQHQFRDQPLSKSLQRNRSIDSTIRQSKGNYQDFINGYSDQNVYEEHYKKIMKEKERQKQQIIEELDDQIQQILQYEKELLQLNAEKEDLEQEIAEFNGEKIYIDMLKLRLENVKEKIKRKTDTVTYLKRKEQELNKQIKEIR
ncbi:hypothetical protein TTHERM_00318890 (macronuclear) [Tetrahymena thermophila SB210]|uniref:Uncharacterized protein n=1 Tax=Tetrahymena thermophila (strain SB210) TaxID=312017 RepID=I7ML60_TETTS|nr:hypothetical protein TTHERM_00318890 [Tetrahymena thermophila SB210]EAS01226.1 hypothetical protein TTHERM_00318890 [Tetrahymena thermophila SB210]|eukprot:XP_001021471.1 hypothetical protein TTHERM_00318890 [Tetrahymena thermophila SB210]